MGVYPATWGHHQWFMLHLVAQNIPETPTSEDLGKFQDYLSSSCRILPCPGCSAHAVSYLEKNPLKLSTRDDAIDYVIDFHNDVNKRTGKKVYNHLEARELIRKTTMNLTEWMDIARAQETRKEDHQLVREALTIQVANSKKPEAKTNKVLCLPVFLIVVIAMGILQISASLVFYLKLR